MKQIRTSPGSTDHIHNALGFLLSDDRLLVCVLLTGASTFKCEQEAHATELVLEEPL